MKLVTDLGTENGIMASLQSFFRDDFHSHRYVPSPRNQRIEHRQPIKSCGLALKLQ